MIKQANNNQNKLLNVLNEIFVYTIDPQTNKKKIRINPKLTDTRLQQIVVETRAIIITLYLKCEIDYTNGVKIYESIVEKQILETAKNQIDSLEKMSDTLITEEQIPKPAEINIIQENKQQNIEEHQKEIDMQVENIKNEENVKI
jgi:hypothetical protein